MKEIEEVKLTKIQLSISLILIVFFCVTGATYAYFTATASNNVLTGNMATVNLTLDVEKVFPTSSSENTGVMVPQLSTSSEVNSPLSAALKSGCVDANENVVCQVYKINIQNIGGTATQVVDGNIYFYGNPELTNDVSLTMPNLMWKLITFADSTLPINSVLGTNVDLAANASENNVFADDVTLKTNDSHDYYMIIWVNETNSDQKRDEGNSFYTKVTFNSSNGTGVTATFTT